MSRSYYHTPWIGVAGRSSRKSWRTQENRRYRAYVKNLLRHQKYDNIQNYCGRFANEWDSPTDGRYWFGDLKYKSCCFAYYFLWGMKVVLCDPDRDYHNCKIEYYKLMRK